MKRKFVFLATGLLFASIATGSAVVAGEQGEAATTSPDVQAQMEQLNQMCAASAEARAARQAESPLYDRLGGYDKISALTVEIVRLHGENEPIRHLLDGVDTDALAKHVADFVASGTGGPQKYTGRDMVTAHEHLALTDADFLAAGGDIVKAMQSFGYGQEEIDEIVCILVSLKDQVVLN